MASFYLTAAASCPAASPGWLDIWKIARRKWGLSVPGVQGAYDTWVPEARETAICRPPALNVESPQDGGSG